MHPYVAQQIMDSRQRERLAGAGRTRRAERESERDSRKPVKGTRGQTRRSA